MPHGDNILIQNRAFAGNFSFPKAQLLLVVLERQKISQQQTQAENEDKQGYAQQYGSKKAAEASSWRITVIKLPYHARAS